MRPGPVRRRVDPVQGPLLPVCDSLPDLRRRGAVPPALRRRLHQPVHRRLVRHAGLHPSARRGPRLVLAPRLPRLEMSEAAPSPAPFPAAGNITDADREELRRHGILLTSLEELYGWGRSNSIWPLQFGLACCAIEMIAAATARFDIA